MLVWKFLSTVSVLAFYESFNASITMAACYQATAVVILSDPKL